MSLYRKVIQDSTLIVQKRKMWPRPNGWRWVFRWSEEDHLNRMKNKLLLAKHEVTTLQRRIPQEEDRLKKSKEALAAMGSDGAGSQRRDSWKPRREPVRLLEIVKVGRKAKDRPGYRKPEPIPLATIVTAGKK